MKTKAELDQAIIDITTTIHEKFPELAKFITEIPVEVTDNEEVMRRSLEKYYHSLQDVLDEYAKRHDDKNAPVDGESAKFPGYEPYPASDDIFIKSKEEASINPENISKKKAPNEKAGSMNEKDFNEDMSGDDLDVPGSELDDQQENVGSEDEENNYYSIGGDNHNDLEEDKG